MIFKKINEEISSEFFFPVKRLTRKREKASCDNKEECKKKEKKKRCKDHDWTLPNLFVHRALRVHCILFPSRCWCVLAFSTYYVYVIWEILRDQIIARLGWRRGEKSNIPNLLQRGTKIGGIYLYFLWISWFSNPISIIILYTHSTITLKHFRRLIN